MPRLSRIRNRSIKKSKSRILKKRNFKKRKSVRRKNRKNKLTKKQQGGEPTIVLGVVWTICAVFLGADVWVWRNELKEFIGRALAATDSLLVRGADRIHPIGAPPPSGADRIHPIGAPPPYTRAPHSMEPPRVRRIDVVPPLYTHNFEEEGNMTGWSRSGLGGGSLKTIINECKKINLEKDDDWREKIVEAIHLLFNEDNRPTVDELNIFLETVRNKMLGRDDTFINKLGIITYNDDLKWNEMERDGIGWNEMESDGVRWG